MSKIKIALGQIESVLGNKKENIEKALKFIAAAGKEHADIICFPELFLSGYHLGILGGRTPELSEDTDGENLKLLRKAAEKNGIYVILPMIFNDGGVMRNSAFLISRDGKIEGVYSKNHMFGNEADYFIPEHKYPVFETDFGKIGIMICYDMNFPEPGRILALKGANIIFVPAAWRIQDGDKWDLFTQVRALENTVYLAAVNGYGNNPGLELYAHSKIIDPLGNKLVQSDIFGDDLLIQEISPDFTEDARKECPYLKDIQIKDYGEYLD